MFIENIVGGIIFEFIGAFGRWVFIYMRNRLKGRPTPSFAKVWNGRKRDFQESVEYGVSNVLLGVAIVMSVIVVLMWIGI